MTPIAGSNNRHSLAMLFQELLFSGRVRHVPQPSLNLPALSGAIMSSDKTHRTLKKSFATLSNNDDWHSLLKNALLLAQANSQSETTLDLVKTMLDHLRRFDECCHTLETEIELPDGIDPGIFLTSLTEEMVEDRVQCSVTNRILYIRATIRGSLECAQALFDFKTRSAIQLARLKL